MEALYVNWCSFGHNGHKTRPEGSVLINYTRREDGVTPFTKVLVKSRSFPYQEFFKNPSHPIQHEYNTLKKIKSYNVLSESMSEYYSEFPKSAWDFLHKHNRRKSIVGKAFIAHYNIKSDEDFDLRVKRGLKGDYAAEKMWGDKTEEERKMHHHWTNAVEDLCLHDYWYNYLAQKAWSTSPFPKPRWPLITHNAKATQSSTLHPCSPSEDAAKLINQAPRGHSQAHTGLESRPWWQIEFEEIKKIHEVRLFNRLDGVFERMNHFALLTSSDQEVWFEFYERTSDEPFGGMDGTPFVWVSDEGIVARWLRIELRGEPNYLNLDQVEIYGTSLS
ncbi:discoidin domain-containing protein [Neokomagataea tanensis]|uniref:Discoidin domain-containing protein n=2 Tax=Neokomagataea TaxID=1223423 RepID=A0A4Y6V9C4_9PROT|nr:discoidin domain-containing protein [Neokomagataea tanensis]QDH24965.1 discoidin domain-containing protein [Neokomagataea tanensis]